MARGPVFEVIGLRRLRATLKAAGDDFGDLKRAHDRAAQVVAARGRATAPVGETGRLAGSVRGSGTKAGAVVRAGSAAVPYAGVQEWGWPVAHIPAQPSLVPAAHDTEPVWMPIYEAEVDAILAQVKGA